jgi:hypothetical protein
MNTLNNSFGKDAIEKVAADNNTTSSLVEAEIQALIDAGMSSEDTSIREFWQNLSNNNTSPTPRELIEYLSKMCRDKLDNNN